MGKTLEKRTWFTPRQAEFLRLVGKKKEFASKFYLTGGTALSGYYYNHRFSEDLDFFSREDFSTSEIANLLFSTRKDLGWYSIQKLSTNINGFRLTWKDNESLLIDFVYYSFPALSKNNTYFGIKIDSLEDICANKIETILLRSKGRDFVDFYTILKNEGLTVKKARQLHKKKHEIIISDIEMVKAFLKVHEIEDYPTMKIPFSREKIIKFFEGEAMKLKPKIFRA